MYDKFEGISLKKCVHRFGMMSYNDPLKDSQMVVSYADDVFEGMGPHPDSMFFWGMMWIYSYGGSST